MTYRFFWAFDPTHSVPRISVSEKTQDSQRRGAEDRLSRLSNIVGKWRLPGKARGQKTQSSQ